MMIRYSNLLLKCWLLILMLAIASSGWAQFVLPQRDSTADPSILKQLLNAAPEEILRDADRLGPEFESKIKVDYLPADLDGSGHFDFLVAYFYFEDDASGYISVFRNREAKVTPLFTYPELVGGATAGVELLDIDGDGIAEIKLEGTGVSGYTSNSRVLHWTGVELVSMIPEEISSLQVDFADLDGDARLEMIGSPYYMPPQEGEDNRIGDYEIYVLENGLYKFLRSSKIDPVLGIGADGEINIIETPDLTLSPSQFPISQVGANAQSTTSDNTPVHLFIRKLVGRGQVEVPLDQLDPSSIWIDPGIHPIQTQIVPDSESSTAGAVMLDIFLPRAILLKRLQWLQPTARLAVGDSIGLSFHARVKDGRTVIAAVSAKIVADSTQ